MGGAPRTFAIDMGGCLGWTLQRGNPDSTEFIRCVNDDEFSRISNVVTFCRRQILKPPSRLLVSAYQVWCDIVNRIIDSQEVTQLPYGVHDELESAFVGWLLIWRLVFDQIDYSVCCRFGKESAERSMLSAARHDAYDSHQGYRVIEAMRNLVQHRDMPPLNIRRAKRLDPKSGEVTIGAEFSFPVSWLLQSSKCPAKVKAEFNSDPTRTLDVDDIAADAMAGFHEVFIAITKINYPESVDSVNLLRQIFSEAHPGLPILLRIKRPLAGARVDGGMQVQVERIDDLLKIVREAPFGNPFTPSGEVRSS